MNDIISAIRNSLDQLKSAEKRVAECVLREPGEVIKFTITELAEQARTSEPTVVRFCRKMGLKGYMELRLNLARSLPSSQYIHETISEQDSALQILGKIFSADLQALRDTMNKIDAQAFNDVVDVLAGAKRIEFYGLGGSGIVAQDAYHKFFRLEISCIAIVDPHLQVMSASLLCPGCVAVAVSDTGSSKDIIESVNIAKESGATVVGITGRAKSPLARICDFHLSVHSQEAAVWLAPMSSRVAQVALLDVLFVAVAVRNFEETRKKLEKVKRSLINKRL
jgi:RpiR family carbohydrate utilization transcriptional regulator